MSARAPERHRRDRDERLLAFAAWGLPAPRAEWGTAMRAELAAIDDSDARRRFARSASAAAFTRGYGIRIAFALGAAVAAAAIALLASRAQLQDAGPGLLSVTVPVPALLMFAVALATAALTRSFRFGFETGALAFVLCFAAVFAVVAVEGLVWMDRLGVFVLDGDPPKDPVSAADVVFDLFSTGMWVGHVLFWLPCIALGAALGLWIAAGWDAARDRRSSAPARDGEPMPQG